MRKGFLIIVFFLGLILTACKDSEVVFYDTESSDEVLALEEEKDRANFKEENIFVDVEGAVRYPGVYELDFGSRVFDAIKSAGGLISEADIRNINQALLLSDGEKIYVPYEGENRNNTELKEDNGLVNINTADISELKTLPGIGDVKAKAIVEYRKVKGLFKEIDDIKNVDGIKGALYEKIKDSICV